MPWMIYYLHGVMGESWYWWGMLWSWIFTIPSILAYTILGDVEVLRRGDEFGPGMGWLFAAIALPLIWPVGVPVLATVLGATILKRSIERWKVKREVSVRQLKNRVKELQAQLSQYGEVDSSWEAAKNEVSRLPRGLSTRSVPSGTP